jgi:hypothetical protein
MGAAERRRCRPCAVLSWQAGKSVAAIHELKPAAEIVREFDAALYQSTRGGGSAPS